MNIPRSVMYPLLLLAVLAFCIRSPFARAISTTITPADCRDFVNELSPGVTCGYFSTPLFHDQSEIHDQSESSTGQVSLPILIASATPAAGSTGTQKRAILIPGGGGPGAAIGFGYFYEPGEFLEPYKELRDAGFDIVIVDQRGAGFATPKLSCTETATAFQRLITRNRTIADELDAYQSAVAACKLRYNSEDIDVTAFDTQQSALDFIALINSLSYDWWGTIATSYATAIAQAMVFLKKDIFQAMVLDSPVPLDYQQPVTTELSLTAIMKTVNLCQSNKSCTNRHPDLAAKLDSILERADKKPYRIKIAIADHNGKIRRKTLVVDDSTLLSILFSAAYNNESIMQIPHVIAKMHSGSKQALNPFAEDFWYQGTDVDFADGLNLTVHCRERQQLEDRFFSTRPDNWAALSEESKLMLTNQKQLCSTWAVKANNRLLPKYSFKLPALIIAGGLDPVIAAADINHTRDNFSSAQVIIDQSAGHSVWYQSKCTRKLVAEYLANNLRTIKSTCHTAQPDFR